MRSRSGRTERAWVRLEVWKGVSEKAISELIESSGDRAIQVDRIVSAKASEWGQTWYGRRQSHPPERTKLVRQLVTSEERGHLGGNDSRDTQVSHPASEIQASEFPAGVTAEASKPISPFAVTHFSTRETLYLATLNNTASGGKQGHQARIVTTSTAENNTWFSLCFLILEKIRTPGEALVLVGL